jgi:hypothetical protein
MLILLCDLSSELHDPIEMPSALYRASGHRRFNTDYEAHCLVAGNYIESPYKVQPHSSFATSQIHLLPSYSVVFGAFMQDPAHVRRMRVVPYVGFGQVTKG